jgi:hypothetical protein
MVAPPAELIPDQKPAQTPTGKPTLHKRNKTERNQLYVSMLASHVLATVKEALAVCPGLEEVTVAVLRRQVSAGLGPDRLDVVCCGTLPRTLMRDVEWSSVDLSRVLDEVPQALIRRRGAAGDLQPVDLTDEPRLADVVAQAQAALVA